MNLDKEQIAIRAAAILDDPVYKQTWESLMADIMSDWRTGDNSSEEREDLFHKIQALDSLNNEFKQLIYTNITANKLQENDETSPYM